MMRVFRVHRLHYAALVVLAVYLSRALPAVQDLSATFASMDNDDILRLVMVRDLLAGQGWFDTTQYRFLPPDGVVMHWSRYIDLGIAAVIGALAPFMPLPKAELWATAIWPALIFVLHGAVVVYGTARLFGALAGALAGVILVIWPVTGLLHAGVGNLDHHNVQMLLLSMMALALVWPDQRAGAGAVAGAAAALSLAIGLETLPMTLALGAIALGQMLRRGHDGFVVVFALVLALTASLLFWGQMAPSLRGNLWCDRLALPVLALAWVAAAVCLAAMIARPWGLGVAMVLAAAVLATGLALIWPSLGGCLAGPYGNLPQDLQMMTATRITEARSALLFARESPASFVVIAVPVLACLLGAAPRQDPRLGGLWLLVFCGLGLMLYQIRTMIGAGAVVPILGGALLAMALRAYLASRSRGAALRLLALSLGLTGSVTLGNLVALASPPAASLSADCRDPDGLAVLNQLPPAVLLTPLNLGPAVLWASHHAVVSAGYHVDAALLGNGLHPFDLAAHAAFLQAAQQTGAAYLLLCGASAYEGAAARDLAGGAAIAGLTPVPLAAGDLRVFAIAPR